MVRLNNFEFVRMFAALAVIISHSYPLIGVAEPVKEHTQYLTLGGFSVAIFFSISGYLVHKSYLKTNLFINYIRKRVLRIFPAFILMVFVTILYYISVVGFSYPVFMESVEYFLNTTLVYQDFRLKGLFVDNYSDLVNGSIWTIRYEFICYFIFPVLFFLVKMYFGNFCNRKIAMVLVIASLFLIDVLMFFGVLDPEWLKMKEVVRYVMFFCLGALFSELGFDCKKYYKPLLILFVVAFFLDERVSYFIWLVSIPVVAIGFGLDSFSGINKVSVLGDPSYGIYLYGMLIQQIFYFTYLAYGFYVYNILCLIISVIAGYISYHILEKKMMGLSFEKT